MEDISYLCNPLVEPFVYETIRDKLERYSEETPDKEAIVFYTSEFERQSLTFGNLYRKSWACAQGLIQLGIQPGDVVGLGLPNIPEWILCHFGIALAGAITLGFPYFSNDGQNIVKALNQSEKCTAIIFGDNAENIDIIRHFVSGTDGSGKVLKADVSSLKYAIRVGTEDAGDFPFTFGSLLQLGEKDVGIELPTIHPDDVFMIILSSGTTSPCKLISKTHFHILSVLPMTNHVMRMGKDDIVFSCQPFMWIGGYVFSLLNFGNTLVTVTSYLNNMRTARQFAKLTANVIEKENCTFAGMYGPSLLVFSDDEVKCSSFPLKCVTTAGFPLSKTYANIVGKVARRFINVYGTTELGSICYKEIERPEDFEDYSVGFPVRGIEITVIDKDGKLCQRNVIGEINVRSSVRFLGYLNDQEKTIKVLDKFGWFKTNDIGYVTSDGQVVVSGRLSDIIIIGGKKMSPVHLANVLSAHPDILDVEVIAIEDKVMFQEACACLIKKPGSTVTWDDLEALTVDKSITKKESILFRLFVPKYHVFMDSFPRTMSGKVEKKQLKEDVLKILKLK
ncbi:medium-chain acyl-CoA ligase ACSF2, mitochondrial-like [Mytilus californianus]|uniref:medium-chain acyl-CoA ligase ACSF2, mitochondrial-like n=1 Tax=Mytilus californianus TaxID=6549 RepID=UPI0022463C24|nr:medium-chain acyl-CoA ligase ACSF2, mitochondrial-like [Mytilus californianus]